ncbi:hypothetical protein MN116_004268 [Schistosoma mekongi]|uniref:Interleukin-4 inducing immunoglobulin-binding domain-containing protein n=1 Tax=Schistosoma mekongi TaxID=38744 RepID=A0AAE2D6A8_SCHME|nr:hypothetical protein MN116_004268 [Schistosoma mekongi]
MDNLNFRLLLLITILLCLTSFSFKLTINETKVRANSYEKQNKSKLLTGIFIHLECLRMYSEISQTGYWFDICDSNEVISPYLMMTIQSICAPSNVWYRTPRYWLGYQQPYFTGSYILLGPGQCVANVRTYGIVTIGSILQCQQSTLFGYLPTLNCYYPQQPWRQFGSLTPALPVVPLNPAATTNQHTAQQLITGTVSLLDLQRNSANEGMKYQIYYYLMIQYFILLSISLDQISTRSLLTLSKK